jgi:uncharacterized protein (TIGR03437 family)
MLRALGCCVILLTFTSALDAHAPPTPVPSGPLRADRNRLVDSTGQAFVLRGVRMSGLEVLQPSEAQTRVVEAMTAFTFRVLRQRWNMNALRLPVSPAVWERDGEAYLRTIAAIARTANDERLVVVLAATGGPVPGPAAQRFWSACAAYFKDSPLVIFSLFDEVAAGSGADAWRLWKSGGTLPDGRPIIGMQTLVAAIRATGAAQIVSVPGLRDAPGFRGFLPPAYIEDANIMYEAHIYFDRYANDAERFSNFGFLAAEFPVYAGEWGLALTEDSSACSAVPAEPAAALTLLFTTAASFDVREISWTAATFEPGSLIAEFNELAPTLLDRPWTCGQTLNPQPGMGEFLLLWMTGDPGGFGYITPDLVANAAGGPAGPVAPGEIVTLHGQGMGPETRVSGRFNEAGALETELDGSRVLFDGVAAPVFSADLFQITVQVPYEISGKDKVAVRHFYRDVPSNHIELDVIESAPELFRTPGGSAAVALNESGKPNSRAEPAARTSIVTLYASGAGVTSPPGVTGQPAAEPYAGPALPVIVMIAGERADLLFAGSAPGMVGVLQINARLPGGIARGESDEPLRAQVTLQIGARAGQSAVHIWVLP